MILCLSINPLAALSDTSDTQEDVKAYVDAAEMERPTSPEKIEQIKCATASDPQLRRVLDYIVGGWPKYAKDVPGEIRQYHAVRGEFSIVDGKIIYHNRHVIPSPLQSEVLERIHDGHQGVARCRERANITCPFGGLASAETFKAKSLVESFAKKTYRVRERNHSSQQSVEEDWCRLV